jgi:transposase
MRFVPVKKAVLMMHRARNLLVLQRTIVNALRAHLAEFGAVAPQGLCPSSEETGVKTPPSMRHRRTN